MLLLLEICALEEQARFCEGTLQMSGESGTLDIVASTLMLRWQSGRMAITVATDKL